MCKSQNVCLHIVSILWLTHKYGQIFCDLHTHFLFCDLHTLLEYGKAGAVAKNLLIIDLCTVHPVRAKNISKTILNKYLSKWL